MAIALIFGRHNQSRGGGEREEIVVVAVAETKQSLHIYNTQN